MSWELAVGLSGGLPGWELLMALGGVAIAGFFGAICVLRGHLSAARMAHARERRCREEMEAYVRLDTRLGRGREPRELAERVCALISERSPFQRVAMLLRDADKRLYVAANKGMEPAAVEAVKSWATESQLSGEQGGLLKGVRLGAGSVAVTFGEVGERGIVVPLRAKGGRMTGALVVMAASVLEVRRRAADEAVISLEALATKLGRAMENTELAERLLRAEKLAGLGLLAGGVAHSLNNPLTAVMGFADLIRETAEERVRGDAATILGEARRMREIVESLLNFWRPPVQRDEPVDLAALVKELAAECGETLRQREIRLDVDTAEKMPPVRGNLQRLRLVLEHLLNNAAQAIATARETSVSARPVARCDDAIRLTVSHDGRSVQMIVSDTGTGFGEPQRVFEPFYTTQALGGGSGLGLSICYGIVREHEGEISAFNLHPAGAAVVVELPVAEVVRSQSVVIGEVA
jgi:signal transduction histidine kinase